MEAARSTGHADEGLVRARLQRRLDAPTAERSSFGAVREAVTRRLVHRGALRARRWGTGARYARKGPPRPAPGALRAHVGTRYSQSMTIMKVGLSLSVSVRVFVVREELSITYGAFHIYKTNNTHTGERTDEQTRVPQRTISSVDAVG